MLAALGKHVFAARRSMLTPSGEHGTPQFRSDNALGPIEAGFAADAFVEFAQQAADYVPTARDGGLRYRPGD